MAQSFQPGAGVAVDYVSEANGTGGNERLRGEEILTMIHSGDWRMSSS